MNKSLEQVRDFHLLFSHPVGTLNTVEELSIRQLRIKLLFEELMELAEASDCKGTFNHLCETSGWFNGDADRHSIDGDNINQIEELDALCDIQYVLNGKILTGGYHEIFDREFSVVHENNMTKAHTSREEAEKTCLERFPSIRIIEEPVPGRFIVKNESGKIIKPWNHTKVALSLKP